ncbi:hypothetical protein [Bradyrhizobium yuanmingense]
MPSAKSLAPSTLTASIEPSSATALRDETRCEIGDQEAVQRIH